MDRTDLLGEAGSTFTVEHNGRKYRMSRMIGRIHARWELWLREQHVTMLRDIEPWLPEEMYRAECLDYALKLKEGYFRSEGEHSRKMMETVEGRLKLIRYAFEEHHPDMTDDEFVELLIHQGDAIEAGFKALMGPAQELIAKKLRGGAGGQPCPIPPGKSPTGPTSTAS